MTIRRYIWLLAVCVAAFFISADALQTDIMESRNLVTANEMVEYGNWLVPTMNGELRLEKPPLPTWVAAAIQTVAPGSLTAQRAAAGVMGALWALFLFLTVEAVTRRADTAGLSTLVFLTCYSVVLMGRTATWDIYCHAFMQGAVWLLFRIFYTDPCARRRRHLWMFLAAGLLMGLSFLSKGPVSFFALLLPFLIACAFYGKPRVRCSGPGTAVMLAVLVAVSAWWYVYIYVFHTDLATAVLHKESGAWVSHNVRPWYYYWRYFLETGAWSLLTLAALLTPLFVRELRGRRDFVFAVVWMLASVVLLSFMPEKKTRYLLPVMAPCAMSVGVFLMYIYEEWNSFRAGRVIFRINGWLLTVITAGLAAGTVYLWLGRGHSGVHPACRRRRVDGHLHTARIRDPAGGRRGRAVHRGRMPADEPGDVVLQQPRLAPHQRDARRQAYGRAAAVQTDRRRRAHGAGAGRRTPYPPHPQGRRRLAAETDALRRAHLRTRGLGTSSERTPTSGYNIYRHIRRQPAPQDQQSLQS